MSVTAEATAIRPFQIDVPEEQLAELRRRVDATRWPSGELVDDRSQGVRLATIGVYGWTFDRFLDALGDADVGLLVDVRQRRGVRGREYAWANAQRLQRSLAEAGIAYSHHKELAPTTELRQVQYAEDDRLGVGKRSRTKLAPEYRERYLHEILEQADLVVDGIEGFQRVLAELDAA